MSLCQMEFVNNPHIKQLFWGLQRLDEVLSIMPASKYVISQCLPLSPFLQPTTVNLTKAEKHHTHRNQDCDRIAKTRGIFQESKHCLEVWLDSLSGTFLNEDLKMRRTQCNFWFLTQILGPDWSLLWKFHFYRLSPNSDGFTSLFYFSEEEVTIFIVDFIHRSSFLTKPMSDWG